jgi:CheY-like chemotaxis protein
MTQAQRTQAHAHTILVVDDDRGVRDLFVELLEQSGHHVELAADGNDALTRLQGGLRPCLVLSDVRMPRMDGWDLSRAVRRMDPDLPVVLLTADRLLSYTSPARDKPVAAGELEAVIRRSCRAEDGADGSSR